VFRLQSAPPTLQELPLLLAKCTVWGLLSGPVFGAVFLLLNEPGRLPAYLTSPRALFFSSIDGVVWALTFYIGLGLGNSLLKRSLLGYPPAIQNTIFVVFNLIATSMAVAIAGTLSPHGSFTLRTPLYLRILVIDSVLGLALSLVIRAFIHLKLQVERTQAELQLQALETARAQALALQSQINPHFFFNTLNTISALIDDDPAAARRNIARLADMFRYTLGCTHNSSVELEQELDFVRDYLAIEQERFRRRLKLELPGGPAPPVRVPGLILQPLVENAVKHGIAGRIEGGTVTVRVEPLGSGARVTVRNTSDGEALPGEPALFRPGHALENVRARLRMFTGRPDPLRMATGDGWTEFGFDV